MSHTAEIIAVGTELLLGNITNTNARELSESLSTLGINVFWHTVVGDNPVRLADAVAIARSRADLIITSPGGAPRDCNLYQAQKALATAEVFANPEGPVTLILVARAEDGIGPDTFQEWLIEAKDPDEVIERFRREGFNEGTNKAFEYARALKKGKVVIVSENVDADRLRAMKIDWAPTLQAAVDMTLEAYTPRHVIVLPKAVSIIPHFPE